MRKADLVGLIRGARDRVLANDLEEARVALSRALIEVELRQALAADREAVKAADLDLDGRERCARCGHLLRLSDGRCWFCGRSSKGEV